MFWALSSLAFCYGVAADKHDFFFEVKAWPRFRRDSGYAQRA